jgi:hypothetical protein
MQKQCVVVVLSVLSIYDHTTCICFFDQRFFVSYWSHHLTSSLETGQVCLFVAVTWVAVTWVAVTWVAVTWVAVTWVAVTWVAVTWYHNPRVELLRAC